MLVFVSSALLVAAAATAVQQTTSPDNSEIIVTGMGEVDREIRAFVDALTIAPVGGQISRFEARPVCPLAVGLSPAQREAVVARMRRVAEAAGIAVGGAACTPNVLVIAAPDKRALIEGLEREHPYILGDLSDRDIRRLADSPGPAAAWQLQGPPVNADGVELSTQDGAYTNRSIWARSPRIRAPARPQFAASVVVVERSALVGLTTTQLADYAAMRAFAQTDPSQLADSAAPTILKVLEASMDSAVPITLTEWDLGFLRALYRGTDNLYAAAQRSEIRRRLGEELQPGDTRN